ATAVRDRLDARRPGAVAVGVPTGETAVVVVAVNEAARGAGADASVLVKRLLSGRGGGSPVLAQGGGLRAGQLPAVLAGFPGLLAER
ncbi:DHHA1 domain-containing protein, partial [Streptomyces albus]